jgi:hypothetical protein
MDESKIEARFDHLTKLLESVAKQVDVLARATEREFRDLHHSLDYRFERTNERLDILDGKMEAFGRRVDFEVEERHKLSERLTKVEKQL